MPTRNISLTDQQDAFVEKVVRSGDYQNASEAIRDALRVLQQKRREDSLRLRSLRKEIQEGIDSLESGDFVELDVAELDGYFKRLAAKRNKR